MASAISRPVSGPRQVAARFCTAAAMRGLRRSNRGGRRLLPSLLGDNWNGWATAVASAADCRWRAPKPRLCGRCLADPPKLDRMRAAVAYDELPRSIALRLKYGRKVALARTMARYMAPLKGDWSDDALLMPVPLAPVAPVGREASISPAWLRSELSATLGPAHRLPSFAQGQTDAAPQGPEPCSAPQGGGGGVQVAEPDRLKGRTIVLIDDVLTSGSTAEACARRLAAGGSEPSRADLLGKGGSPGAAHALRLA